jgi:hypothetical protein
MVITDKIIIEYANIPYSLNTIPRILPKVNSFFKKSLK